MLTYLHLRSRGLDVLLTGSLRPRRDLRRVLLGWRFRTGPHRALMRPGSLIARVVRHKLRLRENLQYGDHGYRPISGSTT